MSGCTVTFDALVDYLAGEPDDALEEHVFACDACTDRLERIAALGAGVRRLAEGGAVIMPLTGSLDAQLAADGVVVRTFRCEPGTVTLCGVAPDDVFVAVDLVADLRDVQRASFTLHLEGWGDVRHEDVAFSVSAGVIRLAYPGRMLRALSDSRNRIDLTLERPDRKVELQYILAHTAAGPPAGS